MYNKYIYIYIYIYTIYIYIYIYIYTYKLIILLPALYLFDRPRISPFVPLSYQRQQFWTSLLRHKHIKPTFNRIVARLSARHQRFIADRPCGAVILHARNAQTVEHFCGYCGHKQHRNLL